MLDTIKKINKVLRVVFVGFIAVYGVLKIFDVVPKEKKKDRIMDGERKTSEFDELW